MSVENFFQKLSDLLLDQFLFKFLTTPELFTIYRIDIDIPVKEGFDLAVKSCLLVCHFDFYPLNWRKDAAHNDKGYFKDISVSKGGAK